MRAHFRIKDPDSVEASITITTTLKEWKELRSQLPGGWPATRLSETIGEAVRHAERHFYGQPEEGKGDAP